MGQLFLNQRIWKVGAIAPATFTALIIGTDIPVTAQSLIVPDDTLGDEQSQVIQNFGGLPLEVILGGAQRSQNLFHSFEEFNVDEGRGAIFFSPDDVNNIFSRVTGSNPSTILGVLGTLGSDADLFFINPNGILFGPNSSLNVQGSFAAITADAIQFGDQGFFRASDPEIPSDLLTINPSALFFNQGPAGSVASTSTAPSGFDPTGSFGTFGLRVPDGRSLLLVGGDIDINGGGLIAFGGRIDLAAIGGPGTLSLSTSENMLGIAEPTHTGRADISLTNGAALIVAAGNGGDLSLRGGNLTISEGSTIQAGILSGIGLSNVASGDIFLQSTGLLDVTDVGSQIVNVLGPNTLGNGGNLTIQANQLRIRNGAFIGNVNNGEGNIGDLLLQVDATVDVNNGGFLTNQVNLGSGNSGDLIIEADQLDVDSNGLVLTDTFGQGNSGDLIMRLDTLTVRDGSQISSSVFGQGNSGTVRISATQTIEVADGVLNDTFIRSNVQANGQGNSGGISIDTGSLSVIDGGQIQTVVFGEGDAGPITITADESVTLDGRDINDFPSSIASSVEVNAIGTAGDIDITADVLEVTNRAQLNSSTSGLGDAGDITLRIDDQVVLDSSIILSEVSERGGVGTGGDIIVTTDSLQILNGSSLLSDSENQGNAGNIDIISTENVILLGEGPSALDPNIIVPSQISTTVDRNARGEGGNIDIDTGLLLMTDDSFVRASTLGQGNAGDITIDADSVELMLGADIRASTSGQGNAGRIDIEAKDIISLDGRSADDSPSLISTNIQEAATGNSGGIEITTQELHLTDRSQVSSTVAGTGNSQGVTITADDRVTLSSSIVITEVEEGTGNGNGGDITITTGVLELMDGAALLADTENIGNAGNITIDARDSIVLNGIGPSATDSEVLVPSQISTTVESTATGNGGNIAIATNRLTLRDDAFITSELSGTGQAGDINIINPRLLQLTDGAFIAASTGGQGDAGNIEVRNAETVSLRNSTISTTVNQDGVGQGGRIIIGTDMLELGDRAQITSSTSGQGDTGVIQLRIDGAMVVSNSSISSEVTETANGQGQDITIRTDNLNLNNNALISARSFRTLDEPGDSDSLRASSTMPLRGNAGNIQLIIDNLLMMSDSDITTQAEAFAGGEISIRAKDIRLFGDSDITSNVQSGAEGGGNITLTADSILAFDDSDILAFAEDGIGGDITFNTLAFFGENFSPEASASDSVDTLDGNDRVDINATGAVDGVIVLPDVSFIQNSLNDLPESVINTEALIANSCVVHNEDGSSTFVITGADGLPNRPSSTGVSDFPTGEIQSTSDTLSNQDSRWEMGDPIIEAQGVYQLPHGELVMSHVCR